MTAAPGRASWLVEVVASPRFGAAATTTALGVAILANAVQRTLGLAGLIAALSGIAVILIATVVVRIREIEWSGLLPVSLLLFLGWAGISLVLSQYQWATLGGLAYLLAFSVVGVSIALTRDTIQVVRAFGDAMRFALGLSLALEILAGAVFDSPLPFLGIQGNLSSFGPIQGVFGTRNQLALAAILGLITFAIELLTKSVSRFLGFASLALGALLLLLSRSPIVIPVALVIAAGFGALALIRMARPDRRTVWQLVLVGAVVVAGVVAWLLRSRIIELFAANSELTDRVRIWQRVWQLIGVHRIEGWGWVGRWPTDLQPYASFGSVGPRETTSALNAYLDVWLQLGLVGVFLFGTLVLLAFTRSWLLAGRRRNIVQVWPALVLLALIVTSLGESSILTDYGWVLLVTCTVKAAQELSWRTALRRTPRIE